MNEKQETAWKHGYQAAMQAVIANCRVHVPSGATGNWSMERAETVQMLRLICEEFGDNDWEDTLHLSDVVEKHLFNHLQSLTFHED